MLRSRKLAIEDTNIDAMDIVNRAFDGTDVDVDRDRDRDRER